MKKSNVLFLVWFMLFANAAHEERLRLDKAKLLMLQSTVTKTSIIGVINTVPFLCITSPAPVVVGRSLPRKPLRELLPLNDRGASLGGNSTESDLHSSLLEVEEDLPGRARFGITLVTTVTSVFSCTSVYTNTDSTVTVSVLGGVGLDAPPCE
ncbi:uncharacterized protein LOC121858104 [Homarus americanus]|uniref:uncharacterized protein LOC121858104 n=1 Tax=Homarus americanus TaxID=6706 RepID=UPI001C45D973|nr:uncharacterized protein LOC121858104 [Homarus americanus]